MQMFCVFFQLADITIQCFDGFLQLAFPMADPVDKSDSFFFLDLTELFAQPFHGMQCRFSVIDHFDPVQCLTFFDKKNDLFKQTGLVFCHRFFPDKCILVRAGFNLCSVNKYGLSGDFSQIMKDRCYIGKNSLGTG